MQNLQKIIKEAFDNRSEINHETQGDVRLAVYEALKLLDNGTIRVCEKIGDDWQVNQWIKKAILLSFRLNKKYCIKFVH